MILKNTLYRRVKDGVEVVTLYDQKQTGHQAKFMPSKRSSTEFIGVRYVKTGRKGYLKVDDLGIETLYKRLGKVDPAKIWESSPLTGVRQPENPFTAAAEEDLRETEIRKRTRRILEDVFPGVQTSTNARVRLEEAVHMLLAGI